MAMAVSAVRVGTNDDAEMKAKPWWDKMFGGGGGDQAVLKKCVKVAADDMRARVSTFKRNVNTIEKLCAMYGTNLIDIVGESSVGHGVCEELNPRTSAGE